MHPYIFVYKVTRHNKHNLGEDLRITAIVLFALFTLKYICLSNFRFYSNVFLFRRIRAGINGGQTVDKRWTNDGQPMDKCRES